MKRHALAAGALAIAAGCAGTIHGAAAAPAHPGDRTAQMPGAPGGTGGVLPPGGRLPGKNGGSRTPEGTNPGPLPPGSNGGPPPKDKDQMPRNLNPRDDPDVRRGYEEHQKEYRR